ncbi:metallophosphoesterase family protein [Nonomuraea sp. M3C6]|uniref:Metallophosphoesterase family protein n=1 Tax=Nonomuraea marmarensis TaxID=3351344 RepID=A0ABW7AU52_9ACTN
MTIDDSKEPMEQRPGFDVDGATEHEPLRLNPGATIVQVSDSHLSPHVAQTQRVWQDIVRYCDRTRPELVVHTGDLVYDDPDAEEDHEFAAAQLRRLTVPYRVVPGNHDIGDTAPDPYRGQVTTERLARYRRFFGTDRWSATVAGWLLVGINSQLLGGDLPEEGEAQWDWLDMLVDSHPDRQLALFLHKPPCIQSLDESLFVNKSIAPAARRRLLGYAERGVLKLIGSGHLHEFTTLQSHGVTVVVAPSAGRTPVGAETWGIGLRCNGVVEYRFRRSSVSYRLLTAADLLPPRLGAERREVPAGNGHGAASGRVEM